MIQPRGLDHLIHLVRDLDAAGAVYEALGFTVSAENRHPFGTRNRIVQFPGVFVEILGLGDHAPIPESEPRRPSFAAFHRDLLARRGEGGSGVVLESRDARADASAFAKAGIGDFEPFLFERRGRRPDGSEVHVAFEFAFAEDAASPDTIFFACEHKRRENFWNPAAQAHPNGATGVAAAMLAAENPSDHHVFLKEFTGVREFRATSAGLLIATPRGAVEALTPTAFERATGAPAPAGTGLGLAGLRLKVADLDHAARSARGVTLARRGGRLVADPAKTFGLTISFEDEASSPS